MLPLWVARRLELSYCEEGKLHKFTHTWQFCNEVILHSLNYWTRTAQTDVCLWQSCVCCTCSAVPPNANRISGCHKYILLRYTVLCRSALIRNKLYFCGMKASFHMKSRMFTLQVGIWEEFTDNFLRVKITYLVLAQIVSRHYLVQCLQSQWLTKAPQN